MNSINTRKYTNKMGQYPVWHPYTTNHDNYFSKLNIIKGEGIYLYDNNGNKYFDVSSGLWNMCLGYSNHRIKRNLMDQIENLSYCSLFEHTNDVVLRAANILLDFLGEWWKQLIYTCSGSESIEVAMKLMRGYWESQGIGSKKEILSFSDSYHGTYYGSISLSGMEKDLIKDICPIVDGIQFIDAKYKQQCKYREDDDICNCECLKDVKELIVLKHDLIAGIVIEPILASKGVFIPCKKYLINLFDLCREYNLLITFDEVALGFYRTGSSFYHKKLGIEPDILCLSKGINGGYLPLGATVIGKTIKDIFYKNGYLLEHGSTQGGNTLACAAMESTIKELLELNQNENLIKKSEVFQHILYENLSDIKLVKEIRMEGFMMAIHLSGIDSDISAYDIILIKKQIERQGVLIYLFEEGITLLPMLITTYQEWGIIVHKIAGVLKEYSSRLS